MALFLIFTENGKVLATFLMWGKLFQMFLDPDKKSLGPLKDLDGLIDEVLALDSVIWASNLKLEEQLQEI